MLRRAISLFPALRDMGFLNLKGECEPFPDALPEYWQLDLVTWLQAVACINIICQRDTKKNILLSI